MASLESHGHRLAKQLLVSWFREASEKADGDGWSCCGLYARPNRNGPFWGVHEEYPVCEFQLCGNPVWDEEWDDSIGGAPPTRDELLAMGMKPLFILDIACQHKGNIAFGIEIVHKNPVSEYKGAILNRCEFPTFVIESAWVLAQVGIPDHLVLSEAYGIESAWNLSYHLKNYEWSRYKSRAVA